MALRTVLVALATQRTDGSALAASDLGSVPLFQITGDGAPVQIATLDPLTAVSGQLSFDVDLDPGIAYAFFGESIDKQDPPLTSDPGERFPVVIAALLAKPNPPVIVSVNPKS